MTKTSRLNNSGVLTVSGGLDEVTLGIGSYYFASSSNACYLTTQANSMSTLIGAPTLTASQGIFTLETWLQPISPQSYTYYIASDFGSNNYFWLVSRSSTNNITFTQSTTGTTVSHTSTANVNSNTWTHFAMTVANGAVTLFINGSIDSTFSLSGFPLGSSNGFLYVGGYSGGFADNFKGYMYNFIVSNTVVYKTNFTPSLTAQTTSNTALLLTAIKRTDLFKDYSNNRFTITNTGVPAVTYSANTPVNINLVRRELSTGIYQIKSDFDEVTLLSNTTTFSSPTIKQGSRMNSNGTLQVTGGFDEVTGIV